MTMARIQRLSYLGIINIMFLMELEHPLVTSKGLAFCCDPLLLKVYNYVNHGWPNVEE